MLLRHASIAQGERDSGQMGLFGGDAGVAAETPSLPETPDWPEMERLEEEFAATGIYLSGHPLDEFATIMKRLKVKTHAAIVEAGKSGPRRMAGTLMGVSERTSKKGNRYAFLTFSDTSGVFEVLAFSEILSEHRAILENGHSFFIRATFEKEDARFTMQDLEGLAKAAAGTSAGLAVVVESTEPLAPLRDVLEGRKRRGKAQVRVISRLEGGSEVELELPGGYAVSAELVDAVRAIPGIVEVREI
ncbi:MAG: hypothetical protein IIC56_06635 [Proteobacteria bacterium]|nr:hypothetical protein [Pseudomonadota bacterium]